MGSSNLKTEPGYVLHDTNTMTSPYPLVVSLSNHERSHLDKLRANGSAQWIRHRISGQER